MKSYAPYQQLLERRGLSLQRLGIADIALTRADAILAAKMLRDASVPVLGGDVYFRKSAGIEIAYANWYCEKSHEESHDDFVLRSCVEAIQYIERFPSTEPEPFFALVIDA